MKHIVRLSLFPLSLMVMISGCKSLETADRSIVNHRAMQVTEDMTPARAMPNTPISDGGSSGSGGCAVCAK